jgi:hypothetical protein
LLLAGTGIAAITGLSLLWPGTFLDGLWALNPAARREFATLGSAASPLLLALATLTTIAGVSLLQMRRWGWGLTVGLLATNCAGDAVRFILGDYLKGAAGMLIAGGFLIYLIRPEIRKHFERTP